MKHITLAILYVGALASASAGELEGGRAHYFNTLRQIADDPPAKKNIGSELQTFQAFVDRDPITACWPELLRSVQTYLGVKVEGGFERIAWESANGAQHRDTSSMEVRITYPGLQGLSIGQWDYQHEPQYGRWLCNMKLSAAAVSNLKDYVTLGRIKGYELNDDVAIGNAVVSVREIAKNFRQRNHMDLAVEADNLAGALNEKLLQVRLNKGSVSIQPICDRCSEGACMETLGKLRAAGVAVGPVRWELFRRPVIYYANERVLEVVKPILKDLSQSEYYPVEAVQSLTPTQSGYHANLLIADRITPYTDAKRGLASLFPSICRPMGAE